MFTTRTSGQNIADSYRTCDGKVSFELFFLCTFRGQFEQLLDSGVWNLPQVEPSNLAQEPKIYSSMYYYLWYVLI